MALFIELWEFLRVVGFPHDVKGNALHAFVIVRSRADDNEILKNELRALVAKTIGPIAKPDRIQVVSGLPKTRSGKIMRRIQDLDKTTLVFQRGILLQ